MLIFNHKKYKNTILIYILLTYFTNHIFLKLEKIFLVKIIMLTAINKRYIDKKIIKKFKNIIYSSLIIISKTTQRYKNLIYV